MFTSESTSKNLTSIKFATLALLAVCTAGFATIVNAGGDVTVQHEQIVNASPTAVWEKAGDFTAIDVWHPAITSTEITQGDGSAAGDKRLLTLGDGATIKETLLELDNSAMSMSYSITESPLPIKDYESTLMVEDAGDGNSKVSWSSTLSSNGVSDDEAAELMKGIYEAGLTALAGMF